MGSAACLDFRMNYEKFAFVCGAALKMRGVRNFKLEHHLRWGAEFAILIYDVVVEVLSRVAE